MELNYLNAIILGLTQGITEWLPISSSGHLAVVSTLTGYTENLAYDTLLHIATLLVVIFYFRKDILRILKELKNGQFHTSLNVIIATIPVTIIGLLAKDYIEHAFSSLYVLGCLFILNGYILKLNKNTKATHTKIAKKEAFKIGMAQILALAPGISRSGVTIIAANRQGIEPTHSATFSFLIAIPTIAGAFILNYSELSSLRVSQFPIYLTGSLVAAISGYFTLKALMWIIKKSKLHDFAYYSWIAGAIILLLSLKF
jgi:undecaprenyl-diphosphatase